MRDESLVDRLRRSHKSLGHDVPSVQSAPRVRVTVPHMDVTAVFGEREEILETHVLLDDDCDVDLLGDVALHLELARLVGNERDGGGLALLRLAGNLRGLAAVEPAV